MKVTSATAAGALLVLTASFSGAHDPPRTPTFAADVLPLLQRQGCSSAYCHGGATGKGGLKLSLFGSDPDADWRALAVDQDGRRLDLLAPDRSLLLRKPSLAVPHQGGERLPADSAAYQTLRGWIAAGAGRGEAAVVRELTLARDGEALRVTAALGDGERRDVTALATFASSDPRVATVTAGGALCEHGPGEALLTARYAGADATLRLLRPWAPAATDEAPLPAHPLDQARQRHLRQLGLAPVARAGRHALLRRLFLDLAGRTPTLPEQDALAAVPDQDLAAVVAERLLAGPDFTALFAAHLADWLEVPREAPRGQEDRTAGLRARLQRAVRDREPLFDLAEELLRPGEPLLERHGDPRDRAEYAARAFLGIRVGCARCHDHPLDRWRQHDHLGLSALLATRRGADGTLQPGSVYDDDGRAVEPRLLPLAAGAPPGDLDAHGRFRWLALQGSDAFARTISNRVLGLLLGEAPVLPLDDHRPTNPVRFGELLATASLAFARSRGDLRGLVTLIVTSAAYAADSAPQSPDGDPRDALLRAHLGRRTASTLPPATWRAAVRTVLELPPPDHEAEDPASPLAERLQQENGAFLRQVLAAQTVLPAGPATEAALRDLYRRALCREPTTTELQALAGADLATAAEALFQSRAFGSRR